MFPAMSLLCLIGRHKVSLASVMRKRAGFVGICERCDRPLERAQAGSWTASDPLDVPQERAA
jgi:hypothetical protein